MDGGSSSKYKTMDVYGAPSVRQCYRRAFVYKPDGFGGSFYWL